MTSATKSTIKTASVLAFERKLDASDALFFAGDWKNRDKQDSWTPIRLREKSVRGTISNRLKAKDLDAAKLDAAIQNPNLQTIDIASLPPDADTLNVQFSLRVLSGIGMPSACNDSDYQSKLLETIKAYVGKHGLMELARRYAANLANGRFLWRNRVGAEQVEVVVEHQKAGQAVKTFKFDSLSLSLRHFDDKDVPGLGELSKIIESGLLGSSNVLLRVSAFVRMGQGQEVFPSQELILDKGRDKGAKSRTLYDVQSIAAMHSQKISNAIRTVDDWYSQAQTYGPIAVEPYGSVTTLGAAFRQPKEKRDFYGLLDNWIVAGKEPSLEDQHFVVATLIRGGVFGDAESK